MNTPQTSFRSTFRLVLACLASFLAASLAAQDGVVSGRVSNAGTKEYLEGAVVTLDPGNQSQITTNSGEFTFTRVPAGTYTLNISYTGLDTKTVRGSVTAGGRSDNDIQLTSQIYQLDKVIVAGEREGNAAAVTAQRNADNVKTIMASDAFGNVADLNIGNFIMRMPGVTKFEQEGDVTGIMIRGIADDLSMVTIDGEQGASASPLGGMKRAFEVDKISADFIESIEVIKSLTPDMDAGAVGGVVNMKSKSALSRKGRHFNYQAGEAYNVWRGTMRPYGSLTYSDVLGAEQRFGALLTMSYNQTNKPRDNSNFGYEATTDTNRPIWFNANPWGEDWTNHRRFGLSARLDYKLSPSTLIFGSAQYTDYHVVLDRRRGGISNPTAANLVTVTNDVTEARGQTFTYTQTLIERTVLTENYMLGAESKIFGGKLELQGNYSPSHGHQKQFNTPRTVANVQLRQDRSISHNFVTITQTGGPDIFDPRNTLLNTVTLPEEKLSDRVVGAQLNFTRALETRWPLVLKAGGRYRAMRKTNDETQRNYAYVGPNGVAGPIGAANDDNLQRFFDPNYSHKAFLYPTDRMPYFDGALIKQAMRETPNYFTHNLATSTQNSIANDVALEEKISAAYVMGTLKTGKLTTVAGVRFEETRLSGDGFMANLTAAEVARRAAFVGPITPEETIRRNLAQFGNPIHTQSSYNDLFPSINFKYALQQNFLLRAGYSESIGRPALASVKPTITANFTAETLTANNPNLKPQGARNYDLSAEYYFKSTGLVSLGAFRKELRNFIFRAQSPITLQPGNPYGEEYNGFDLTTDINGGTAWVQGLEFAYSQQFSDFQIRLLRPFGVFANFTWLRTQGNYIDPNGTTSAGAVPNFTPRSGNIGISWIAHGWTVRVKGKYEGDRLRTYNANPANRIYTNNNFPIDVNVAYNINRQLTVFCDVINVFDARTFDDYQYIEDRPLRTFKFSTYIKAGISGRF